jgi:SAM-dependent methyltransferase
VSPVTNTLYRRPDLYDVEFGGYRADVRFYGEVLRAHPGLVVEPGCGTGRLWRFLRPPAYVGLDGSAAMLGGFRAWANQGPPLGVADVGALPLASGCASVVVLAYNLVHHLWDEPALDRCLREAARVTRPGGVVALDVFMPPRPGGERVETEFGSFEERTGRAGARWRVGERTVQDAATGVQATELRYEPLEGPGGVTVLTFTRRTWGGEALLAALGRVGLVPVTTWGDVDGRAWTSASPRLMVACRPGG